MAIPVPRIVGGRMRRLPCVLFAAIGLALTSRSAFAYIDPGTSQQIWSTMAPILGILLGFLSVGLFIFRAALGRVLGFVRKCLGTKRRVMAAIAFVLVCGLAALGWRLAHGGHASAAFITRVKGVTYKRVIVIGMDGLDPRIVERMMDDGRMPNFAKLAREGTFSTLQTTIPPESPVAWVSAATGMNPGRHGLYDFIRRDPEKYLPDLSLLRTSSKGLLGGPGDQFVPATAQKPFWDLLGKAGIKTTVLRWPVTFPAEPLNGRLLSGLGTPDVTGGEGRYTFFTTAPRAADDKAPDRVVEVKWNGTTLDAELPGPEVVGWTGRKTSTVPLHLERSADRQKVALRVGKNKPVELAAGAWSGFFSVAFPGGTSPDCPAMVRFYLTSVQPELKLYATAAQVDPAKPAFPITYPKNYAAELERAIGPYATLGMPEDAQAVLHGRMGSSPFFDLCNMITQEREAMFEHEVGRFDSGLLATVFDTIDRVQHMSWRDTGSSAPPSATEPSKSPVIAADYRRMDALLGKALLKVDAQTAIFVISDHGFTSFDRAAHVNRWLIENGFMHLKKSDELEAAPLLSDVDWSRTKAYAVGFCGVYLNLTGREGQGVVLPGAEASRVRDELVRALRGWSDPDTGRPVMRNVYRREEIYHGECLDQAPDLILGFQPGYRGSWQTAIGAAPAGRSVEANLEAWSGDHMVDAPCVPGTFVTNLRCAGQSPSLVDIAPTVLRAFGLATPDGMDGRSLF